MNTKELFEKWLKTKVRYESTVHNYINTALKRDLPNKLKELNEKDSNFNSILEINDIEELAKLYKRLLKNGDLNEFNQNSANRMPSAALGKYIEFLKEQKEGNKKSLEFNNQRETEMQNENNSLNQILYGPPGTGKTYNTIDIAIEIIEPEFYAEYKNDRKQLKEKFNELKESGQIEFVTFHQSYGYEEFVEGIKAESDENGNLSYIVEPGIFKKICEKALIKEDENIDKLIEELKNYLEENSIEIDTGKTKFKVTYRGGKTFRVSPKNSKNPDKDYPVNIDDIKKLYRNEKTRDNIYNSSYSIGILNYLYDKKGLKKYEEIENKNSKNYILIIDEINRGNISKIFGELITLIEKSKRIGAEEEIKVKLPYSGDEFGVPQNLYILGTMNTADRSIALLDTALRRRFEFVEMMPKSEVLKDIEIEGINLQNMLETINKRIEYLYDRDHTIGHSYFLDIEIFEDLKNVFKNKIIPLLQEYFYDDYEKIMMVLGKGFIEKKELKSDIFDYKNDDYLDEEKYIYEIREEFDFSEFK